MGIQYNLKICDSSPANFSGSEIRHGTFGGSSF